VRTRAPNRTRGSEANPSVVAHEERGTSFVGLIASLLPGAFAFRIKPTIETALLDRPGQLCPGIAEGTQGPVAAAIANATYDAASGTQRSSKP